MAALLAAIMSTVDSQVLVAASAITRDLRRALRRQHGDDRRRAREGRLVAAGLVLVAMILAYATHETGEAGDAGVIAGLINKLVLFAWGGLGAAFGPALLLALYFPRMTGSAAFAAMLTGETVACVWRAKPGWLAGVPDWLSYELTVAFPLALLVGLLVALVTGREK